MNSENKKFTLEISNLFNAVGIQKTGLVEMNDNTYDFDPENPKNSWLYLAFLGFQELRKTNFDPKIFVTIGTGSGIDSIGANEIFDLKEIYQTDIHPNIIEIADKNARTFISNNVKLETYLGDLCQPLIERSIKADLVYANIPNIPSNEPVFDKKISASKFSQKNIENCPEIFQKYLLTLQFSFLKETRRIINKNGLILNAIGARVPYEILQQLFTLNGYKVNELVSLYKIQSEPEDILFGYSQQELSENIEFDFYDHEKALPFWSNNLENQKLSTLQIKDALKPFRISATKALQMFEKENKSVGHICTILKANL